MVVLTVAVMVCAVGDGGTLWIVGLCVALLLVTALLAQAVHSPLKAVQNGMYLLREQDFSSRLRPIGQADADMIVEVYNTLIDSMRAERLKNLEQNRFLSQVVDASPLGVAICDFDGRIVQTNRAWEKMQSPRLAKAIDSIADGTTGTVRVADSLIVRISRLWFMDKGVRRRFILVEKLTDEIIAAEKQMFNTIVRTIGHEVNNSLGSVMSVLESLEEMHAGDPLTADAIKSCSASCANLVGFVRGYADIVKLPAPVPEQVDLHEWLMRLRPALQALVTGRGITLEMNLGEGEAPSRIDPMLMERVLVNIVKKRSRKHWRRKERSNHRVVGSRDRTRYSGMSSPVGHRQRQRHIARSLEKTVHPLLFNQKSRPRPGANACHRHSARPPLAFLPLHIPRNLPHHLLFHPPLNQSGQIRSL